MGGAAKSTKRFLKKARTKVTRGSRDKTTDVGSKMAKFFKDKNKLAKQQTFRKRKEAAKKEVEKELREEALKGEDPSKKKKQVKKSQENEAEDDVQVEDRADGGFVDSKFEMDVDALLNGDNEIKIDEDDEDDNVGDEFDGEEDFINAHKKELEALKENDPDFYAHLQETDPGLLEFDEEEEEDLGIDDESENQTGSAVHADDPGKKFTHLKKSLMNSKNPSIKDAQALIYLLAKATESTNRKSRRNAKKGKKKNDDDDEEEEESERVKAERMYWISHTDLYHQLINFAITEFPLILFNKIMKNGDKSQELSVEDLTKCTHWRRLENPLKKFCLSLIRFVSSGTDGNLNMHRYVLTRLTKLTSLFVVFPQQLRNLLKTLTQTWCLAEDHSLRLDAFLFVRSLIVAALENKKLPNANLVVNLCLRTSYMSFMRTTHIVTPQRWPVIQFLINCLVDLYSLDTSYGYRFAYVYLRQLVVHLRNAITNPKDEGSRMIHGWQFMNSLRLWTCLVCSGEREFQPLVYPISQIILGLLHQSPSNRFLPCRIWCARLLAQISRSMSVFIPFGADLLLCLESKCFSPAGKDKKKDATANAKLPELKYMLRANYSTIASDRMTQEAAIDEIFELLKDFFSINAETIAFPELSFPLAKELNQIANRASNFKLSKAAKSLSGQVKMQSDWIERKRKTIKLTPQNLKECASWLPENEFDKCPLRIFFKGMKTSKEDMDEETLKLFESLQKPKKQHKVYRTDAEQSKEEDEAEEDFEVGDGDVDMEEEEQDTSAPSEQNEEELMLMKDVIEDFVLDDDE